ncbi:hypothetical protein BH10ACT11_BH10ACT11_17400 [soil metagenome]
MTGTVSWISVSPVKGLRMEQRKRVELTETGVPGDRAFFLADKRIRQMVSATRLGPLIEVVAKHDADANTLALTFPDGKVVSGEVGLGPAASVGFYGLSLAAQPVLGPFAEVLSEHSGKPLLMFAAPANRPGVDRGHEGAATVLSVASLERLREVAGESDPIDPRRFRMTFGAEGLAPHEEDEWVGHDVRIGDALIRPAGLVGRCAATTRNADTGVVDLKTLHHLQTYRDEIPSDEPLPFGVYGRVIEPGTVRLADPIELA